MALPRLPLADDRVDVSVGLLELPTLSSGGSCLMGHGALAVISAVWSAYALLSSVLQLLLQVSDGQRQPLGRQPT